MNTKIIDAEWEEIDESEQVAKVSPVPKKRIGRVILGMIGEFALMMGVSLIISRILGFWIYGI